MSQLKYISPLKLSFDKAFLKRKIAVICGGWSHERDVSLVSGKACFDAIKSMGADVVMIDPDRDISLFLQQLKHYDIEIIFNALHGKYGEDGYMQSLFDMLKIPYTHSGARASVLAMHKPTALQIFAAHHIDIPKGIVVAHDEVKKITAKNIPLSYPFVIKPVAEGSSFGAYIVPDEASLPDLQHWCYGDALCEEFIAGKELTCAVLDQQALGVTELKPTTEFYDYDAKYQDGLTAHILPANIAHDIAHQIMEISVKAHNLLGCRGATRCDYRYDEANQRLCLLEINTQPGMTPLSLLPEQACFRDISFEELIAWILSQARHD